MQARVSSPHLVGRDDELTQLLDVIGQVRTGPSQLVLLGGDAGVGKSRLAAEFAERVAADGTWALVGACVDLGEGVPYAPFTQVLSSVAQELDRSRLPALLGPARHELARIVPDLSERPAAARASGGSEDRGRLFGAVVDALRGLARARGPVVVVLEDLHWAQGSTLDLVNFLTRNLDDEPLLLLATFRSDDLHRRHPLRPVLGELARLPHVQRLQLEALDNTQVAALVAAILGEDPGPGIAQDIAARSAGNPFYVEELIASSREDGQDRLRPELRDVVAARLDRLPDPARDVLDVVAVAGRGVEHELLATVTGLARSELTSLLRPAVDRHVLRIDGDAYHFRHELVREVVRDELLPGDRTELHRRIATALEEHPELASSSGHHTDAYLAHHWYAARDLQRAFRASLRAAQMAIEAAAFAEALEHDERALELWDRVDRGEAPPRVRVHDRAASSAYAAGRYQRAVANLRSALAISDDDPSTEAELRRRLAFALLWGVGDHAAAVAELERAHELVAAMPPSPLKAGVVGDRARISMLAGDARTVQLARDALALARELGDRVAESHARNTLGTGLATRGDIDAAVSHLRAALTMAQEARDERATLRAFNNLVITVDLLAAPDTQDADTVARSAAEWLLGQDDIGSSSVILSAALADWAGRRGRWDQVQQFLDWMAGYHMEGSNEAYFRLTRARLRWMQGRLDQAATDTERLHELEQHGAWFATWAYTMDAVVAVARGDLDGVRAAVNRGRSALTIGGHATDPTLMRLRLHRPLVRAEVEAALTSDRTSVEHLERATETLEMMRRRLQGEPPSTPGEEHRAQQYLDLAEAELSRGVEPDPDRWRAVLSRTPGAYWATYAGWRLAESLLDVGRRDEVEAELRAAHDQAIDLGAGLLRREVEALARRAHVPLPGVEVVAAEDLGLTPRETQVLALVARGLTNREVGASLFITATTASVHVSNILAKLDVDDRYAAAARALELGLVDGETPDS